jgi:hypothetical protein
MGHGQASLPPGSSVAEAATDTFASVPLSQLQVVARGRTLMDVL